APAAVATFEPEALAELDAELGEVADSGGRFLAEHGDCARPTEVSARSESVERVEPRCVVVADRGRDPTLRERARRGEKRPFRPQEDSALGGGAERREEPCDSPAEHA